MMPQMSPLLWIFIYFLLIFFYVMNLMNLKKCNKIFVEKSSMLKKEKFLQW